MSRKQLRRSGGSQLPIKGSDGYDFSLVRYFSLVCLGVFAILTTVMCTSFYHITKTYIRLEAEQRAVPIADRLALLAFAAGHHLPDPDTPAYSRLDEEFKEVLRPLGIFKIKIYDTARRIVYSTDPRIRIGREDLDNRKLGRALAGEIISVLQTHESLWDLDEEARHAGAIVETYIPVRREPPPGDLQYVFEIYQDVSPTYARLPGVIALVVGVSVIAMSALYGILMLVVRKADHVIRLQTETIRQAKADMEEHAQDLERRVAERTRQLRETHSQQQQDEKLVALGTLAAGVAHELNTPLGTILASTQMVLDLCAQITRGAPEGERLAAPDPRCDHCLEDLRRVESQAKRCKDIIRNLVGFSRKSDGRRSWHDLGELVERGRSLVAPDARKVGVNIELSLDAELSRVFINENEILQVLVNVMNNGIAAMVSGGTLRVRTLRRGSSARIEFCDTGSGIEASVLPRIFEPFFTTKEPGKGTGLGLSISYRIVKDHGGRIDVTSKLGENTTFVIELPIEFTTGTTWEIGDSFLATETDTSEIDGAGE